MLSFPMGEDTPMLGDIIISLHTAERQARARGHGVRDEVRVLMVHGVCHLLGHDHHAEAEFAAMAAAETALLARLRWVGVGLVAASVIADDDRPGRV